MSTTTTVALITVGGTLGGALLALVGTLITQLVTGRREDRRRQHERDLKRMELEESRLERRREERLEAYRRFVSKLDLMEINADKEITNSIGGAHLNTLSLLEDVMDAEAQIQLISSSEVMAAADGLREAAVRLVRNPAYEPPDDESTGYYQGLFYEAARKELGALRGEYSEVRADDRA